MKILVDGMPRTVGGIGSLILNIAETARNRNDNIDFDFIIAERSAYVPMLEEKGYKYFVVPSVSDVKEYKKSITKIFAENKYDYLWFNNTSKVNIFLPEIAKNVGHAKVIAHPHGVDFEEKGIKKCIFKFLDRLNEKKMFSIIDVPFACSSQAAAVYYKNSADLKTKATVIQNGISVSKFRFSEENRKKIREECQCGADDVLLGAVGRLTKVKNYPFIIELLTDLPVNYKLIIIGEGEDNESLNDLIKEKGIENRCSLLGKRNNVDAYLSAMDFFLMPSFNEGMPYSIIEAQTNGLRCVVSDTLSKELQITDLVRYASLDNKKEWIDAVTSNDLRNERDKYENIIRESGYSIEDSYDLFKKKISEQ